MSVWCKYFHAKIAEVNTPPEGIYTEEKLVYTIRISQIVCILMNKKNNYAGVNQIKYKTRCTLMLGKSASGKSATCCSW